MSSGCRFKCPLVRHSGPVREKLRFKLVKFEEPEVVAYKGHLLSTLSSRLWVKQITSTNESFWLPPVAVHSVDGCCAFLAIDCDSLIDAPLVFSQHCKEESHVLITTFDDLNCVCIDLFDGADCNVGVI